jgi:Uncharacterised nucleotidyltransferase
MRSGHWSRPEHELLVCCARTHLDEASAARIGELLGAAIDWPHLIWIAQWHGVTALLHRTLAGVGWTGVPTQTRSDLELSVATAGIQNRFYAAELVRILGLLRTEGVAALPLKGPVLAIAAYGRLDLRRISDLDLLVAPDDFRRAQKVLADHGYRVAHEYEWESTHVDARGSIWLDLHRGLSPWSFPVPIAFDRFWQRRSSTTLERVEVPCLSTEDTLLTLCVQVAKDGWAGTNRLLKICDIAELLRATADAIDWRLVDDEAARLRSRLMLGFGLRLASDVVGCAASPEVARRLDVPRPVAALVEREGTALFERYREEWMGRRRAARFHRVVRECWRDRIAPHLEPAVSVLRPNEHDRAGLPAALAPLAVLVRPFRLLGKSLAGLIRTRGQHAIQSRRDHVSASRFPMR